MSRAPLDLSMPRRRAKARARRSEPRSRWFSKNRRRVESAKHSCNARPRPPCSPAACRFA